MPLFEVVLVTATFLCALVAGFLFAFAAVAMPGLGRLDDGAFLRAFQVIDGVIQQNQPVFVLVWVGSAVALLGAVALGVGHVQGVEQALLIAAAAFYLLGVQLPTAVVNVPLNNRLQAHDIAALGEGERRAARADFEPRWNRWNRVRTVVASGVTLLLIALLLRL